MSKETELDELVARIAAAGLGPDATGADARDVVQLGRLAVGVDAARTEALEIVCRLTERNGVESLHALVKECVLSPAAVAALEGIARDPT